MNPTAAVNGSRPIAARSRRSKAAIATLKAELYGIVEADAPMTVRQVFYRAVSAGVIDKTEAAYKGTVVRLLGEMRKAGELPFAWIADNTRWMRKPTTWSSLDAMLANAAVSYRRALWDSQAHYVEVWLEKDALAGVLYDVTRQWDVPLMVTRGYPSLSYVHTAAESIAAEKKPAFLYYFGDHDPSGVDIPRNVEARLREFAPEAEITFTCIAVTPEQIARWNLPTRPTKQTDSRAGGWLGGSVEVDAIPPRQLRELVGACIEAHIDDAKLDALLDAERAERDTLESIARRPT